MKAFDALRGMRQRRAASEYPDATTPTITTDDAHDAIDSAQAILEAATQILDSDRLDPFWPEWPPAQSKQTFAALFRVLNKAAFGRIGGSGAPVESPAAVTRRVPAVPEPYDPAGKPCRGLSLRYVSVPSLLEGTSVRSGDGQHRVACLRLEYRKGT